MQLLADRSCRTLHCLIAIVKFAINALDSFENFYAQVTQIKMEKNDLVIVIQYEEGQ
jgi:hypothetical protein